MPGPSTTKPQSPIKKPEPLSKKKTKNTSSTKLPSPIQEQRQSKTKQAKNTPLTKEEWTLLRKALMAVLLKRCVEERPETATTGQLADTILLFYQSVYGRKTSKNVKHTELNNKFKPAAKKLGISGEKSLHATLTEFENWLCGQHYRENFATMLTMNTDEEKWPRDFLTEVVMKFDDTTDREPYAIFGENYSTEKREPNARYCAWWKKIADKNQPEIHRFMQGNAAASPPSAAASPPSAAAPAPACWEHEAPPDVPAASSGTCWNAFQGERAEPVVAPEAVDRFMKFNTCEHLDCDSLTAYSDEPDMLFELLVECDPV
tara:strand:+ start:847 stop:1800 length:954 start_codon:yes stop_codon:yes gene_type:complete